MTSRSRGYPTLAVAVALALAAPASALPPDLLKFDYRNALAESLLFYEAQRSGAHQPQYAWRVAWREPAALSDGSDVGVDLSGGWFDAGDTVKFGLPMAYSAAMLGWSIYEFPIAYERAGELTYARDNLRFALDYLLQAYQPNGPGEADDRFFYQVGDTSLDHAFWGPPEDMTMARPAHACTASTPCSEVTASSAAALAVGALVFATADPAYAARLRDTARALYAFADRYRSSAGYTQANGYYSSYSGYWDELAWGAAWLHLATGEATYLERAITALAQAQDSTYWAHTWDNKAIGTTLLLARASGAPTYAQRIESHLEYWIGGLPRTPGGLVFLDRWGSLRYAATTAFVALAYGAQTTDAVKRDRYQRFALQQINYILGDNPRASSYVCGFGSNPPRNPHHRAAHDSAQHSIDVPLDNQHELTGALVGGPASADDFDSLDDRHEYRRNEVATDYNAGYTAALAAIVALAGDGFTPPTPPATATRTPTPLPGAGLSTRVSIQSDWDSGYCADVIVSNASAQAIDWQVSVAVDGTVTQTWNAVVVDGTAGQLTAGGVSWNDLVPAGGSVGFGFCAARGGPAPTATRAPATATPLSLTATPTPRSSTATATRAPATASATITATRSPLSATATSPAGSSGNASPQVVPFNDWGTGYCANVIVSTTSETSVTWRVSFTIDGRLRELWNAIYTVAGNQVAAQGLSWNALVTRSQPVTFGFCAERG